MHAGPYRHAHPSGIRFLRPRRARQQSAKHPLVAGQASFTPCRSGRRWPNQNFILDQLESPCYTPAGTTASSVRSNQASAICSAVSRIALTSSGQCSVTAVTDAGGSQTGTRERLVCERRQPLRFAGPWSRSAVPCGAPAQRVSHTPRGRCKEFQQHTGANARACACCAGLTYVEVSLSTSQPASTRLALQSAAQYGALAAALQSADVTFDSMADAAAPSPAPTQEATAPDSSPEAAGAPDPAAEAEGAGSSGSGAKLGAIIGGSVGGAVALALLAIVIHVVSAQWLCSSGVQPVGSHAAQSCTASVALELLSYGRIIPAPRVACRF